MEVLALNGGEKTIMKELTVGVRYGREELRQVREALEQNTLFYAHGKKTKEFEEEFAKTYSTKYCIAVSSGSAALHSALAALGVGTGDEVITSPITDMGSIVGIIMQNAVPIFADIDPHTYNITPGSIEKVITEKSKVIMPVHLAGNPCQMTEIMELAAKNKLWVVEDCAQSYLSYYKSKLVGNFGHFGCFSLNDFKHISAGDAGLLITKLPLLARRARLFSDKGYDRKAAQYNPEFLSMNYRISELQSAVGIAQLSKLEWICSRRNAIGSRITESIKDLPGILPPKITEGGKSSYWIYLMRIDESEAGVSMQEFGDALNAEGVSCRKGYSGKCVYQWDFLKNRRMYSNFNWPEDFPQYAKTIRYDDGLCPVAEEVLRTCISIPISEHYTDNDVALIIMAIRKVAKYYQSQRVSG